jgi:6-phosphogluconolactonase
MTDSAPAIEILESAAAVNARGAEVIAAALAAAVAERGRATLAVSGGRTPAPMLAQLAAIDLPWERIDLFQVDERIAPRGHAERNATMIEAAFARTAVRAHWMPVDRSDLEAAADDYARELELAAGSPATLDVAHLGLGADGHTASLFPGSTALAARADVAATEPRNGWRRLTLTLGVLNRARTIVWLVCGRDKGTAIAALAQGDASLVASRVRASGALILADLEAATLLETPRRG